VFLTNSEPDFELAYAPGPELEFESEFEFELVFGFFKLKFEPVLVFEAWHLAFLFCLDV
jgi:hypothetical protein